MALANDQLARLREYNRTIQFIGKFNQNPEKTRSFVFDSRNTEEGAPGAPQVQAIFEAVRPQVLKVGNKALRVGNTIYDSYTLEQPGYIPKAGEAITEIELDPEDALFEVIGDSNPLSNPVLRAQKIGGGLFRTLVQNLDGLAQFMTSGFTNALLTVADGYASERAGQLLDKLRGVVFQPGASTAAHFEHPQIAGAVVKYLLASPADESSAHQQLLAAYAAFPFFQDNAIQSDAANAMAQAMRDLRLTVLDAKRADATWEKMATREPFTTGWLKNYASDPRFDLSLDERIVKGGSFMDVYRAYRRRSDAVHAFARSLPHQSFFFVWLMSKYDAYDSQAALPKVGRAVFEQTMKDRQGVRFSTGAEDQRLSADLISRAVDTALATSLKDFEKELQAPLTGIITGLGQVLVSKIGGKTPFTRGALDKKVESLLLTLGFRLAGPAAKAVDEAEKYADRLVEVHHEVLRLAGPAPSEEARLKNVVEGLTKESAGADVDVKQMRQRVVSALSAVKLGKDERALRRALDVTVEEYATSSVGYLVGLLAKAKVELGVQLGVLKRILALRRSRDLDTSGKKVALPARVIAAGGLRHYDEVKSRGWRAEGAAEREKATLKAAIAGQNANAPATIKLPLTQQAIDALGGPPPADKPVKPRNGKLKVGDTDAASIVVDPAAGTAEISYKPAILKASVAELKAVVSGAGPDVTIPGTVLDADGALTGALKAEQDLRSALPQPGDEDKYSDLSAFFDRLAHVYRNKGSLSEASHEVLKREVRAALLGEFIEAAPEDKTVLNLRDLSQVVGFSMDAVKEIGASGLPATLIENKPDNESYAGLKNIPFDAYYPVPNDLREGSDQIANIIRFHLRLTDSVLDLADYLGDVVNLRSTAITVPTDTRLIVTSMTLAEHNAKLVANPVSYANNGFPSFIYLSKSAVPTEDSMRALSDFYGSHHQNYYPPQQSDQSLPLVPIVLSANLVAPTEVHFPVISAASLQPFEARTNHTPPKNDQPANEAGLIWAKPNDPEGVGFELALLLSLFADDNKLAQLDDQASSSMPFTAWVKKTYGIDFQDGRSLVSILRGIWLNRKVHNAHPASGSLSQASPLLYALVGVRLVNIAILERTALSPGAALADSRLLLDGLARSAGGRAETLRAAFDLPALREFGDRGITLKQIDTGPTVTDLGPAVALWNFGRSEGKWLRVEIEGFDRPLDFDAKTSVWLAGFPKI
ncbi:hypothetical protein [Bradyrhizobium sp. sGM-13]|uniref:hypothetical protein n=1 Tax=Bradyrhizobium sp. sGM-13 TaxID=2831781 RepID=UPI001BCF22E2|nr:hypothetical protein [Bradyrhizobium sp. sGM-13]